MQQLAFGRSLDHLDPDHLPLQHGRMQAPATPFSLGECVESAWTSFKQNMGDYVLAQFVLLVPYLVVSGALSASRRLSIASLSVLLPSLLWTCSMSIARAGLRNGKPKIDDAFRPLTERQGDYVMVCLAMSAGTLACGIGVIVSWFICLFAAPLALDGRDFKQAVVESKDLVFAYPGEVALLGIVAWAFVVGGFLACGIGILFGMPLACLTVIKGFEQLNARVALEPPQAQVPPAPY